MLLQRIHRPFVSFSFAKEGSLGVNIVHSVKAVLVLKANSFILMLLHVTYLFTEAYVIY